MNDASDASWGEPGPLRTTPRPSPVPRSRVSVTARLSLRGGDDAEVAVQMKQVSAHLLVPGLVELRLDLSGLTRCGPEVLGAVRLLGEQMGERGGELFIDGPVADVVLEALGTASLQDVFAFYALLRRPEDRL